MSDEVVIVLTRDECVAVMSAIGWLNECFDGENWEIHRVIGDATGIRLAEIQEINFDRSWYGPVGTP